MLKLHQIIIYDQETEYAHALMNYMNEQTTGSFFAIAFSEEEEWRQYCEKRIEEIDVLVVCEEKKEEVKQWNEEIPILWLHEREGEQKEDSIYKYQSAEQVVQCVLERLDKEEQREKRREEKVEKQQDQNDIAIYAVYSPIGRCGKTNLAKALCSYHEGEALYVGMEEYGENREEVGMMQDFLYEVKVHSNELHTFLDTLQADTMKMSMIHSPACYLDLRQLSIEDIQWFLLQLKEKQKYQVIVFDIGTGSLFDFMIFSLFDRIFLPTLDEECSKQKEQYFLNFLKDNYPNILNKINCLTIPNVAYDSIKMEQYIKHYLQGVSYA